MTENVTNHLTVQTVYNIYFKGVEFDSFIREAGAIAFTLSPQKWITATNAIGIIPNQDGTAAVRGIVAVYANA